MGLFNLKSKIGAGANKFSGRTDYLQGCAAIAVYVASADGSISDEEMTKAGNSIRAIEAISQGFQSRDIDAMLDKMEEKAKGGRQGRRQLLNEIIDCKNDPEMAESVLLVGLDVADSGSIGAEEKVALQSAADALGLNLEKVAGGPI